MYNRAMESIDIGCAVIFKGRKILITQRKPGDSFGEYWEFPGGKVEAGESLETCLIREIREELAVEIQPERLLAKALHPYPEKVLVLHFYLCRWVQGEPQKIDCHDFAWVSPEELVRYKFPPADGGVIEDLIAHQDQYIRE